MTSESGELKFKSIKLTLFDGIRSNFVRLPSSIVQVLENSPIPVHEYGIEINGEKYNFSVGWDGFESSHGLNGQAAVQINPVLAATCGVRDGDVVDLTIRHFSDSLVAREVYIEPQTSDDWEIIERNARFLQDDILHQTRIVAKNSILICYVERTIAKFKIQRLVPETLDIARLGMDTLVVISPMLNKSRISNGKPKSQLETFVTHSPRLLRSICWNENLSGYSVGVSPGDVRSPLAFISIVRNPLEGKVQDDGAADDTAIECAQRIAVKVFTIKHLESSQIVLSDLACESLGILKKNGEKVKIEHISDHIAAATPTVFIHHVDQSQGSSAVTLNGENPTFEESFTEEIKTIFSGCVLTDKLYLPSKLAFIELVSEHGKHVQFCEWDEKKMGIKILDSAVKISRREPEQEAHKKHSKPLGFEELIEDMTEYLTLPFVPSGTALVTGGAGAGKTLLVKELKNSLSNTTSLHVNYLDCESLIESSNFAKMKQLLHKLISCCYWYGPSLLILDNAELLFPGIKSEEEQPTRNASSDASSKLSQIFAAEIERVAAKDSRLVRVLLTAKNREQLNQLLFSRHTISKTWPLSPPNKDQRRVFFEKFVAERSLQLSDDLDESMMAIETEGYSPQDILLFCDKLLFEHMCDQGDAGTELTQKTFEHCIATFTPSSHRGIKLQKKTGVKWTSVGAMHNAKNMLLETLEWPTKYAPIFSECPLRLRSGILLYGYPGCGKTMLASAVAQQCGLNFISIKGPEILNKYIGASEQNIRELFERAQAAKPCILFFDEFDSIAPKRGHDSIGVTDRVVNQMLTQMDGAEGLEGVYVLAATSRPDLIDSALLRPGRLDKSILCGLPDEHERLDILEAVVTGGNMDLEPDCRLSSVAGATEGMSGADLQGLCYNAYLKAVHRNMASTPLKEKEQTVTVPSFEYFTLDATRGPPAEFLDRLQHKYTPSGELKDEPATFDVPKISTQDLLEACSETKPSISSSELQKLTAIYNIFSQGRDANMPAGEASNEIGGRLTLM
ncbi:LAQU0S03e01090g1_1 [Lachancea quebecensis]|uniref:Peroxisomal ATPase PEX1 n=1 Tax=Lachancea quebecensis TaxID=1654605 RepID=A0A0P1KNN3_9SACH|nr:LAQU0S03e01090g1_1 [Lachancea quebecensis]